MRFIVAPKHMHLSLLNQFRSKDPFMDIKLVDKNQLAKYVFPMVQKEALFFLMKEKHLKYEEANMYLEFIPYINKKGINSKLDNLLLLKQELSERGFIVEPLENTIYKGIKVDVFGYYKEDHELADIFTALNINPTYFVSEKANICGEFYKFNKVEDEVFYVLNRIASLLDKGVDIRDILILRRNETYDYFLNKFSPLYGFRLNIKNNDKYISTGAAKLFFKLYDESHSLTSSLEELKTAMREDELFKDVASIVNDSIVEDADFDLQRDYLYNIFKEKSMPSIRYDNAVQVIDSPIHCSDKHVFIMGFAQGLFPKRIKDDKYLNNKELNAINRLNAKEKTKLDELDIISFLNSDNSLVVSYSDKSSKESYFPSPILAQFDIKAQSVDINGDYYSLDALKLQFSNLKDLQYYYKEEGEVFLALKDKIEVDYNSYDPSFKTDSNIYDSKEKLRLSTTKLDQYNSCPYQYYISKVLKLDSFEDTLYTIIGNVAHKMFELCRNDNFDFEREFNDKMAEYSLNPGDKLVFELNLKNQIKEAIRTIKLRDNYIKNPSVQNEVDLSYEIDKDTVINGKIDCLITVDNQYFICIDYKTGNKKLDDKKLKYGVYTQLPTYMMLVKDNLKYCDLKPAGIYINNMISHEYNVQKKEEDLIFDYLRLNGKTIADKDVITMLDNTFAGGKSEFIHGVSTLKNGDLKISSSVMSLNELEGYVDIAKELYKDAISKIKQGQFSITPIFFSDRDNACSYCPFKEICHMRDEFYKEVSEEGEGDGES